MCKILNIALFYKVVGNFVRFERKYMLYRLTWPAYTIIFMEGFDLVFRTSFNPMTWVQQNYLMHKDICEFVKRNYSYNIELWFLFIYHTRLTSSQDFPCQISHSFFLSLRSRQVSLSFLCYYTEQNVILK